MKITTRDFAAAVRAAAQVTERRNTIPILSTVLVQPNGDRMVARGTDLDTELTVDLCAAPPKGAFVGALTEPRSLIQILSGISADAFTIANDDGAPTAKIAAAGFGGSIGVLPADDFPAIHVGTAGWSTPLPRTAVDLLLRVSGAMSTEETRYYLNGVFIKHLGDWTYRFAATDGHRLYYADVQLPGSTPAFPETGAILPAKVIHLIARLRSKTGDKPMALSISGGAAENTTTDWTSTQASRACLAFETAGERPVQLATKLIDGKYPDISRFIPKAEDATTVVTVSTADLRRAVGALTAGSPERRPALKLTFGKDVMNVSAKFVDMGFAGGFDLPCEITGTPMSIGYNGGYLVSILNAVASERVSLLLTIDSAPTMIVDPDGGDVRGVLMPMRI